MKILSIGSLKNKILSALKQEDKYEAIVKLSKVIEEEFLTHGVNKSLVDAMKVDILKRVDASFTDVSIGKNVKDIISRALYSVMLDIFMQKSYGISLEKDSLNVIALVGGYGVGKTLTIAKLANKFTKQGLNVAVASADFTRHGGHNQLKRLINGGNVKYIDTGVEYSSGIFCDIQNLIAKASKDCNILLIDTPAFDHNNSKSMTDMQNAINKNSVTECLLVCDGTYSCANSQICQAFEKYHFITGICLTKLDGVVSIGSLFNTKISLLKNIYYICDGEEIEDIYDFDSETFVNSVCMGLNLYVKNNQSNVKETECEVVMMEHMLEYFGHNTQNSSRNNYIKLISNVTKIMTDIERKDPLMISYSRKKELAKCCNISIFVLNNIINTYLKILDNQKDTPRQRVKIPSLIYDDLIIEQ